MPLHRTALFTLRSLLSERAATRVEIEAFRDARLRELIRHAWERVPYYRGLFERHGITPRDIRGVADLAALPLTSKRDLQGLSPEDVTARGVNAAKLITHPTSGSTGQPLAVRRTWREERLLNAFRRRAVRTYGRRAMDRVAYVGIPVALDPRNDRLPQRLLRRVGLPRFTVVDCLQPIPTIVRRLCELRPEVLSGVAGALWRVALAAGAAERARLRPRFVHVGGEVLLPAMRRQISEAFGAPVYDIYGSHEFNILAWQCRQSSEFHVCDDLLILEVVRDGRPVAPGQRGEVVATSLHSFAMPFIRFRLGDVATQGESTCACGCPFSTIRSIAGRMNDYLSLPDGRLVHPAEILGIVVRNASWLGEYRMVQERLDRVLLRAVPLVPPSSDQIAHLCHVVSGFLGPAVHFELTLLEELPLEPSGKTRVARSLVGSIYDGVEWSSPF
ncbi:MAG: phenylacetate--CoA ligase family protein [Deltaproteobacteria bacterium]|jgi:phenylacetate-CoA ligase|nr:phenylacetate--CoA ligase family protein [Deltaproteobacteria bacterium]